MYAYVYTCIHIYACMYMYIYIQLIRTYLIECLSQKKKQKLKRNKQEALTKTNKIPQQTTKTIQKQKLYMSI